jgi:hypothetical protein
MWGSFQPWGDMLSPSFAPRLEFRKLWPRIVGARSVHASEDQLGRSVHRRAAWAQLCSLLFLVLAAGSQLRAQTTSGVFGTVIDEQGLAITGAEVVVRSAATATATKFVTDSNGNFRVIGLAPGLYTITVTRDGNAPRFSNNTGRSHGRVCSRLALTLQRFGKFPIPHAVVRNQQVSFG